jgi:hypothetical protein
MTRKKIFFSNHHVRQTFRPVGCEKRNEAPNEVRDHMMDVNGWKMVVPQHATIMLFTREKKRKTVQKNCAAQRMKSPQLMESPKYKTDALLALES